MKKIVLTFVGLLIVSGAGYAAIRAIWPLEDRVFATAERTERCPDAWNNLMVTLRNDSRATITSTDVTVHADIKNYSAGGDMMKSGTSRIMKPGESFEFCLGKREDYSSEYLLFGIKKEPRSDLVYSVKVDKAETDDLII